MGNVRLTRAKAFITAGLIVLSIGIMLLVTKDLGNSIAPQNSAAGSTGNSNECGQVNLDWGYNNTALFNTGVTEVNWAETIQSSGTGNNIYPNCVDNNYNNTGPWRVAIYEGAIDAANLANYIAYAPTNRGSLNKSIATAPTTFYTIACIKVNVPSQDNYAVWTPTGTYCNPMKITNTDPSAVDCGPKDVKADGKLCIDDLSNFASKYGLNCKDSGQTFSGLGGVDHNKDGKVDLVDLSAFANIYNPDQCK